jgi:hypothetical protein
MIDANGLGLERVAEDRIDVTRRDGLIDFRNSEGRSRH